MKAKRFTTLLVSGVLAASMLVGCGGINKNETVATLDGQEIKLGVANFAARLQQAEADDFYRAYFGDDVWSSDLYNNGTTMEDNTKNSVIEMIENLYILQNHMADYDVTLTDDETAKIAEVAARFMADNDDKAINALGATEDIVKEYLTLVTVQSKMRAAIVADADTNVSDADANTSAYSYVNVSKTSYKDADGNTQEYTDDEKAELADTVQKFHDAAADTTLDTAADEYGYTVSTGTFSSDNTTLDEEVLNALEGLKSEGELSDVVETDNYYYVLRLDEITDADATEEHRQEIISQRQSDLYNEVLQGWKDEAEWVLKDKVWDKVTFDNLFTTTVESTETTDILYADHLIISDASGAKKVLSSCDSGGEGTLLISDYPQLDKNIVYISPKPADSFTVEEVLPNYYNTYDVKTNTIHSNGLRNFNKNNVRTNRSDLLFHSMGHILYAGKPQNKVIDFNNLARKSLNLPKRKYDEDHNSFKLRF